MKTTKNQASEVRELVESLNTNIKDLEGQGCTVKIHCNSPFNKIDFITIEMVTKL